MAARIATGGFFVDGRRDGVVLKTRASAPCVDPFLSRSRSPPPRFWRERATNRYDSGAFFLANGGGRCSEAIASLRGNYRMPR